MDTLFLVDTGSAHTVLTPLFARRLDLKVPDDAPRRDLTIFGGRMVSVPFVRLRRIAVGTASVPDLSVGVYDALPNARVVDGVLGADFLHRFRITVDTTQRVMRLATPTVAVAVPAPKGEPARKEVAVESRPRPGPLKDTEAIPAALLESPPVWKPGYEWSYRWHSPQGSGTFVWSVDREDVVDGIPVYVVKYGQREALYRRQDLALYMERNQGATETRWVPPLINYSWPLALGKTWEQTYTRERPMDRQTEVRTLECRTADREEQVTVPAGTFAAVEVTCRFKPAGTLSHEFWYSPQVRHLIRDKTYFSYGLRERELTQYRLQ